MRRVGDGDQGLGPPVHRQAAEAGGAVLDLARRIVADSSELVRVGREAAGVEGTVRIGCSWLDSKYVYPGICREFSRRYPDVSLEFVPSALHRFQDALLDGSADVTLGALK